MAKSEQQELVFGLDNETNLEVEQTWYQDNIDFVLPVLIIATGFLQFILRKWILPVSEDVISKLENQFPSQGLIYNPVLGIFLIIVGIIILLIFNIHIFI